MGCGWAETLDGKQCCPCCGETNIHCEECKEHKPQKCGCSPCSTVLGCREHNNKDERAIGI